MADDFTYDVFLSHSSKDKAVVRAVAERLRADDLRVWFDEWELKPGDSIPAKIEDRAGALPRARALHVGAGVRLRLGDSWRARRSVFATR